VRLCPGKWQAKKYKEQHPAITRDARGKHENGDCPFKHPGAKFDLLFQVIKVIYHLLGQNSAAKGKPA
jgi:hypothetical protein